MDELSLKNYGTYWNSYYLKNQSDGNLLSPVYVQWICTHKCNYNCAHCGTNAGAALCDELTTDEIKKVIDDMADMGVKFFSVTGGEPLMRKDLFEVLHYAKLKNMGVGFVTNGSFVKKFEKEITLLKPDSMIVSIDGTRDTHNKIRGDNANFDESIQAIEFFNKIGVPTVGVTTTVHKRNIFELEELSEIIKNSKANYWRFNLVIPEGRAKEKEWIQLDNDNFKWLFDFIYRKRKEMRVEISECAGYVGDITEKIKDEPFFCGAGWNAAVIMANGDIMGCPIFESQKELGEGNIREKRFKDIWKNEFKRFRDLKLDKTCTECKYLDACRGGCWIMRKYDVHCLKDAWEEKGL